MKRFKRIFALMMVLCLSTVSTTVSFAAETGLADKTERENYMNYEFPEDAEILYQSEDGVVYLTNEPSEIQPASNYQSGSKRVEGGKFEHGSFSITNPHTLIKTTEGCFSLDSTYGDAAADMILTDGANVIFKKMPVKVTDRFVRFSFKSKVKDLKVLYTIQSSKTGCPIFLYCTLT